MPADELAAVFTLDELRAFDGSGPGDGRVLVALNRNVYDVSRGRAFYGPGGPYAVFAGRDATMGLATFNMNRALEPAVEVSALIDRHQRNVAHWETIFKEKYKIIGTLAPAESNPAQQNVASALKKPVGKTTKNTSFCELL